MTLALPAVHFNGYFLASTLEFGSLHLHDPARKTADPLPAVRIVLIESCPYLLLAHSALANEIYTFCVHALPLRELEMEVYTFAHLLTDETTGQFQPLAAKIVWHTSSQLRHQAKLHPLTLAAGQQDTRFQICKEPFLTIGKNSLPR
jgi:hypothetical protein